MVATRIKRSELNALPNRLSDNHYVLQFPRIPGSDLDPYYNLSLRAVDTSLPGVSNQSFTTTVAGFTQVWRGRKEFSHSFAVTVVECVDFGLMRALRDWQEFIAGTDSGTSAAYKEKYSTRAQLTTFDTTGKIVDKARLFYVWPLNVPETSLSGGPASGPFSGQLQFSYDYVTYDSTKVR